MKVHRGDQTTQQEKNAASYPSLQRGGFSTPTDPFGGLHMSGVSLSSCLCCSEVLKNCFVKFKANTHKRIVLGCSELEHHCCFNLIQIKYGVVTSGAHLPAVTSQMHMFEIPILGCSRRDKTFTLFDHEKARQGERNEQGRERQKIKARETWKKNCLARRRRKKGSWRDIKRLG